ncbi:hypothetical protein RDV78_09905 [Bacillota bacterium LX-D]|nr:hypothetical protein [Bacillota bacterium LX-D]
MPNPKNIQQMFSTVQRHPNMKTFALATYDERMKKEPIINYSKALKGNHLGFIP